MKPPPACVAIVFAVCACACSVVRGGLALFSTSVFPFFFLCSGFSSPPKKNLKYTKPTKHLHSAVSRFCPGTVLSSAFLPEFGTSSLGRYPYRAFPLGGVLSLRFLTFDGFRPHLHLWHHGLPHSAFLVRQHCLAIAMFSSSGAFTVFRFTWSR